MLVVRMNWALTTQLYLYSASSSKLRINGRGDCEGRKVPALDS